MRFPHFVTVPTRPSQFSGFQPNKPGWKHGRQLRLAAWLPLLLFFVSQTSATPIDQSFTYDAQNRQLTAPAMSYEFDERGNITRAVGPPPTAPTTPTPASPSSNISTMPTLSWAPAMNATRLQLLVSTNPNPDPFNSLAVRMLTGNATSFPLDTVLPYNTPIYWKLIATDALQQGSSSAVWSFTTRANSSPTIGSISDRIINEDQSLSGIPIAVGDVESPNALTVTATSSNTALLPNANITITGTGATRTLSAQPVDNGYGTSTITVTVTDDGNASSSAQFLLTVASINDLPAISDISNQTITEDAVGGTGPLSFTIGDVETAISSLVVTATSSNTSLVPNNAANLVLAGTGSTRTLTVFPAPDANGTSTITVTVTDTDGGQRSDTFLLTVTAVNDPPVVSTVPAQSILPSTSTGALPFTVTDVDNAIVSVTATSNNQTLLPNSRLVVSGSGTTRTVTATPVAGLTGTAIVTLQATDASSATGSSTFTLAVTNSNLASLTLSSGTLSPSFSAGVTSYTAAVSNAGSSITVTPTAADINATIKVNNVSVASGSSSGAIPLTVGANSPISIVVTATDGMTKTYTITPTRSPLPSATTSAATAIGATTATLNGSINVNGASTTVTFQYGLTTAYGSTTTVTGSPFNGSTATNVSAALTGLSAGQLYHYRVLAANSTDSTPGSDLTFTTKSTEARLSSLAFAGVTLAPAFAIDTFTYSATVPNATSSVMITAVPQASSATMSIAGNAASSGNAVSKALNLGSNVIDTVITAEDGSTVKTYRVTITRNPLPSATTVAATLITGTTARLNGNIDAKGATTNVSFAYGTTTAYGSTKQGTPASITAAGLTAVTGDVTGLQAGTTYHFQMVAANGTDTAQGADMTFTTLRNNADLSTLTADVAGLSFSPGTTTYSLTVANAVSSIRLTPTVADSASVLKVNNTAHASGTQTAQLPLNIGSNSITLEVTAEDGVTKKTYTLTVTRNPLPHVITYGVSSVTNTTARLIGFIEAGSVLTNAKFRYGTTTSYGEELAATPATVSGVEDLVSLNLTGLQPGTIYHFQAVGVTATDTVVGSDATFTTLSDNANLASLVPSVGTLSPVFDSGVSAYTITVPHSAASITLTPIVQQANATVKVNAASVVSGNASAAIALNIGTNTVTVLVTAQSGVTRSYNLVVTRDPPPAPTTLAATAITATTATLNGSVIANGTTTSVSFYYYPTITVEGSTVAAVPASAAGYSPTAVSAAITGLTPNTSYRARVISGIVSGELVDFRTLDNNADLSSIGISNGALSPAFSTNTLDYAVTLGNSVTSISVAPTLSSSHASVTVAGNATNSGSVGAVVPLSPGCNNIPVVVTAEDGTVKTYNIQVQRQIVDVRFGTVTILNGDTTPSAPEGTDFGLPAVGATVQRSFSVHNTGTTTINVANIVADDASFSVTGAPASVPAGSSATFHVNLTLSAMSEVRSNLVISSDAAGQSSYAFALRAGEGLGGTLDTSFGSMGRMQTSSAQGFSCRTSAILPDGRFLLGGEMNSDLALARVLPSGEMDESFGTHGFVTLDFGDEEAAQDIALLPDGRILIACWHYPGTEGQIIRCLAGGTLDTTFGGTGRISIALGTLCSITSIALMPDGRFVAAGSTSNGTGPAHFAVFRCLSSGALDTSFSQDGKLSFAFTGNNSDVANDVAIDASGRIVLAGWADGLSITSFATARILPTGVLDTTFSGDGKATTTPVTGGQAASLCLQPDGKIIVAGSANSPTRLFLVRYLSNGTLDPSFGVGGVVHEQTAIGKPGTWGTDIKLASDGKIIVGGGCASALSTSDREFAVFRYLPTGVLDNTFASVGIATVGWDLLDFTSAMMIQNDGRIVLAGMDSWSSPTRASIARFWAGSRPAKLLVAHEGFALVNATPKASGDSGTDFGTQPVESSVWRRFELRNVGGDDLSISRADVDSPQFMLSTASPTTLHRGESIALDVRFRPSSTGLHQGTLTIHTSEPSVPMFTMPLQGNANLPTGMSVIPGGNFTMGASFEPPMHTVTLDGCIVAQTETTLQLWADVCDWAAGQGYGFTNRGSGKAANHPVHTLSWHDAVKWCNARSEKEGLNPCYYTDANRTTVYRTGINELSPACVDWRADGYRLPTEAEWESAARGGLNGKLYPLSDTIATSQANYARQSKFATGGEPYTSATALFAANGFGLRDVSGNVAEWCWDWQSPYDAGSATNPLGPDSGSSRIYRGGSWNSDALGLRVGLRSSAPPTSATNQIGFRVVRRSHNPVVRLVNLSVVSGREPLPVNLDSFGISDPEIAAAEYYVNGTKVANGTGLDLGTSLTLSANGPQILRVVTRDVSGTVIHDVSISLNVRDAASGGSAVTGTFYGLILSNPVTVTTTGYATVTTTTSGAYTANIKLGGIAYTAKGSFDANGLSTTSIARSGRTPLQFRIYRATNEGADVIKAAINDGRGLATEFLVKRLIWNAATLPCLDSGSYTACVVPSANPAHSCAPRGTGYATGSISKSGAVSLSGKLADGTTYSWSSYLSNASEFPIYLPIYANGGVCAGSVTLRDVSAQNDGDGALTWIRPSGGTGLFCNGFYAEPTMIISHYTAPAAGTRVTPMANLGGNGELILEGGDLIPAVNSSLPYVPSVAFRFTLPSTNVPVAFPNLDLPTVAMSITASTGLFGGSFKTYLPNAPTIPLQGVVFQKLQMGLGWFVTKSRAGNVSWAASSQWPVSVAPQVAPLPLIAITAPAANAHIVSGSLVTGTASAVRGVSQVMYQVMDATGYAISNPVAVPIISGRWSFIPSLRAGERSTIFVKAIDTAGNESNVLTRSFYGK